MMQPSDVVQAQRTQRKYDILLYGAGGFTGKQTVEYFARHAPAAIRWAIAGHRRDRLEAAAGAAGSALRAEDVFSADSHDPASVDALVAQSRIVLSTAGPFALYGTPVVDACVRFGTHYVDITGEVSWVRELITRYHDRAAAAGTRIINCCGFDSVPSDLGTLILVRHVRQTLGQACIAVHAYFRLRGALNGGTAASVLQLFESGAAPIANDPFLLDPETEHTPRQRDSSQDQTRERWEPELGTWCGPFIMAPTNTRVVRRSAALNAQWQEPYGPEFVYQEALRHEPPFAQAKARAMAKGLEAFYDLLARPRARRLLAHVLPRPGTGPSVKQMDGGWFTCDLVATAESGARVAGSLRFQGDPGNRATVTFVCEAALALATEPHALPGGPARGGVLTPATGLGEVYARRLRRAGVTILTEA